jgi:hypothetical protein
MSHNISEEQIQKTILAGLVARIGAGKVRTGLWWRDLIERDPGIDG